MQKHVYHGSSNGDIKELLPHISTHQKKCIYATDERIVALLFMSKGKGDLDHSIGSDNKNSQLMYVERREGVLKQKYQNVSGYLYELDGSSFNHYDFLWDREVISYEDSIIPLSKTFIPDIYEEILKEEELGNIKIYHYPDRPSRIPLDNSDLIEKYIRFEEMGNTGSIDRLLKTYPEFSERVNQILSEKKGKSL